MCNCSRRFFPSWAKDFAFLLNKLHLRRIPRSLHDETMKVLMSSLVEENLHRRQLQLWKQSRLRHRRTPLAPNIASVSVARGSRLPRNAAAWWIQESRQGCVLDQTTLGVNFLLARCHSLSVVSIIPDFDDFPPISTRRVGSGFRVKEAGIMERQFQLWCGKDWNTILPYSDKRREMFYNPRLYYLKCGTPMESAVYCYYFFIGREPLTFKSVMSKILQYGMVVHWTLEIKKIEYQQSYLIVCSSCQVYALETTCTIYPKVNVITIGKCRTVTVLLATSARRNRRYAMKNSKDHSGYS